MLIIVINYYFLIFTYEKELFMFRGRERKAFQTLKYYEVVEQWWQIILMLRRKITLLFFFAFERDIELCKIL